MIEFGFCAIIVFLGGIAMLLLAILFELYKINGKEGFYNQVYWAFTNALVDEWMRRN